MGSGDDLPFSLYQIGTGREEVEGGLVWTEVDRNEVALEARVMTHEAEDTLMKADWCEMPEYDGRFGAQV